MSEVSRMGSSVTGTARLRSPHLLKEIDLSPDDRLRPSREQDAHHQSGHGRNHLELTPSCGREQGPAGELWRITAGDDVDGRAMLLAERAAAGSSSTGTAT
jgi:hypothetical protein